MWDLRHKGKTMRKPSVDENGVKKGAWSEEEDNKLRSYVLRYGHWNWRLLPKFAGLARCGKSCRLRWVNYLKPGLKRGSFTKEEEHLIAKLHDELGNKWSAMAAKIPGRTDNEIKNFWHTHLKKRSKTSSSQITQCKNVESEEAQEMSENYENFQTSQKLILESSETLNSEDSASSSHSGHEVHESYILSEEQVKAAENCDSRIEVVNFNDEKSYEREINLSDGFVESFWSEPFVVETDHSFTPFMMEEEAAIYLFT